MEQVVPLGSACLFYGDGVLGVELLGEHLQDRGRIVRVRRAVVAPSCRPECRRCWFPDPLDSSAANRRVRS